MVQREVGERLAAAPGSAAYGAPSAKLAAQATARVLAPVSRRVFVPEPHVDSVLLGVTRRQHPAVAGLDPAELGRVIDAAFGQRRKTLRNALRGLGLDAAGVEALGRAAGVDLGLRAERLDVAAFAALAQPGQESLLNRSPGAATMPGHRTSGRDARGQLSNASLETTRPVVAAGPGRGQGQPRPVRRAAAGRRPLPRGRLGAPVDRHLGRAGGRGRARGARASRSRAAACPPTRPTWSWSRPASWPGAPATCPGPASGSARASRSRPASAAAAPTGPPP